MSANQTTRRSARRRKAQIEIRVRFSTAQFGVKGNTQGDQGGLALAGQTRNISEIGLAFVVSASNINRYLNRKDCKLQIVLKLPTGPLEVQAVPIHHKRYELGGMSRGYLIGVRYTEMSDSERTRLADYLRTIP